MSESCLVAENISLLKGEHHLLDDISLRLRAGQITSVMGHNGAGKTLLLSVLHGLVIASAGRIETPASNTQKMIFQTPVLMRRTAHAHFSFASGIYDKDEIEFWFQKANLMHRYQTAARHLSSGEAQKLAVISALATSPDILFADEPTANLDADSRTEIEALLVSARDAGTSILLITHSLAQAKRLSDHLIYMDKGVMLDHETAEAFFAGKRSKKASLFLENL